MPIATCNPEGAGERRPWETAWSDGVSLDDEGEHELKDVPGTGRLFTVARYAGLFAQGTGTRPEEMGHGA